MRRRTFLAAAAATATGGALAGCIRRGPGPREAADPWRTRENVTEQHFKSHWASTEGDREIRQGVRGEVALRRGEFATFPFGAPPEAGAMFALLRADSRLALPFDIATFGPDDLQAYREGGEPDPLSVATALGVRRASFDNRMNTGEYVLVFDNTEFGEARPLDDVTIRVTFAVIY